jgi:anthranilate phosphoribosyltransferase
MISEAIKKLVDKKDLTYDEAFAVINEIMSGETTPVQTAAFLAALSTKSTKAETIDEISGCAAAMRAHATPVHYHRPVLEIVGTGGDGSNSFNISTTAALVAAAGGAKVAKHGNRAASSKSGTADCQEALGIQISQSPELAIRELNEVGMCFFFAQRYHTAMRYVGPIRKELGIRTVFNILGPLTNPASPEYMLLGVYDESLVEPLAKVLTRLGVKRGLVVYGREGLDELSTAGDTAVCEIDGVNLTSYTITPEEFGFMRCSKADLVGGTPEENAALTRAILKGEDRGPRRDTVVMNAGAALYVAGLAGSLEEGVMKAAQLIDSGAALQTLEAYIDLSHAEDGQE